MFAGFPGILVFSYSLVLLRLLDVLLFGFFDIWCFLVFGVPLLFWVRCGCFGVLLFGWSFCVFVFILF